MKKAANIGDSNISEGIRIALENSEPGGTAKVEVTSLIDDPAESKRRQAMKNFRNFQSEELTEGLDRAAETIRNFHGRLSTVQDASKLVESDISLEALKCSTGRGALATVVAVVRLAILDHGERRGDCWHVGWDDFQVWRLQMSIRDSNTDIQPL